MIASLAHPWMTGTWYTEGPSGVVLKDINGAALSVNQTVKLVGKITALNSVDPHFGAVTIQLTHPGDQSPYGNQTIQAHPLQLVVGS